MSGDAWPHNGWTRHRMEEWERRAGDDRLTYWVRVAALAYAKQLDSNHAPFKRGQIALMLGTPGKPYPNVRRAIEDAVAFGWLEQGSYWGCLIVPTTFARRGDVKSQMSICLRCEKRNRSLSERKGIPSLSLSERLAR